MNAAPDWHNSPLILVVDDDESTRLMLRQFLELENFVVEEAADGVEALSAYERLRPDIILMDAMMNIMDGFTACAQLQTLPGGEHTPVLMITAFDSKSAVERSFKVGATDYIPKPIRLDVMLQRVRRLLREKQAEAQIERNARQLAALSHMGQTVAASLDLTVVLNAVIGKALPLLEAEGISILLTKGDEELLFAAAGGAGTERLRGQCMPLTAGIAGEVMQTGHSVRVYGDGDRERIYREVEKVTGYHTRALLAVPLKLGHKIIGVMEAVHTQPDAFSEDDLSILEAAANWAAIAIGNARQHEEIQRRLQESQAIAAITQAISSHLNLDKLLQAIVAAIAEIAHYQFVNVYFVEQDGLRLMAQRGYLLDQIVEFVPRDRGVIGRVLRTGEPALVTDVLADPDYVPVALEVRSLIAVPLKHTPQLIGVLLVETGAERALEENDLRWLIGVSQQLSVALENARLYTDLQKALRQEQTMRAQLVQAGKLSAMGRMVASVAHELNNPLQTIKNCLFLIQQQIDPKSPGNEYLTMALSEIDRLSGLVMQLRDVYRPSLTGQTQALDVSAILEEVRLLVAPHCRRGHVLWRHTPLPMPIRPIVKGSADQLKQVFINLSLNAVDAMKPDGGTLTLSLLVTPDTHQVGVVFQDAGRGIDPENMPNLFDPFFTTKEAGMGLGLAICYDIVQKHAGRITVTSQPGQGATFTVWLPLATQET